MDFAIPIDLSTFVTYYPIVTQTTAMVRSKVTFVVKMQDPGGSLRGELDGWATELKNDNPTYTTCCIQMSHAINMAFNIADTTKLVGSMSVRRKNRSFKIASAANKEFNYLASVDEMKAFLETTFEGGEEISRRADGKQASRAEAKASIKGRPGIVVFMGNQFAGIHTEIWTGDDFHQAWMKGRDDPFDWAPLWFWDIGIPRPDLLPPV